MAAYMASYKRFIMEPVTPNMRFDEAIKVLDGNIGQLKVLIKDCGAQIEAYGETQQKLLDTVKLPKDGVEKLWAFEIIPEKVKAMTPENRKAFKQCERDMAALDSEMVHYKKILHGLEKERLRKRRKHYEDHSPLAMDHGGIYTDVHFSIPKTGTGFRGFKGVSL